MTLYLTDTTPPAEMRRAREAGIVAIKLYPAGATTNSDAGVTDLRKVARDARRGREAKASSCSCTARSPIRRSTCSIARRSSSSATWLQLRRDFPALKIVLEHVTTKEGAQYVAEAGPTTAATITAHHLLYNRNAIFTGGIRPHYYCLPVLKREEHRRALVAAATSGSDALLPRHRQRAACRRAEGARERLRRLLHRASAPSSSTPKRSRRPARSTASSSSPAAPARPSTAWRRNTTTVTLQEARLDAARGAAVRRRRAEAAARRRDARLAPRRLNLPIGPHDRQAAAHRPPDRRRQLAVGQDRPDPQRALDLRRDEHPARLRQLEEAGAARLGGAAARARDPADAAVRLLEGQERERHGDGHRRARPALLRPAGGVRHRLVATPTSRRS